MEGAGWAGAHAAKVGWCAAGPPRIISLGESFTPEDGMIRLHVHARRPFVVAAGVMLAMPPLSLGAQDADSRPVTADSARRFPNTTAGEFTPATGFTIVKTDRGSMNISVYGLFRYINQMPAGQTFVDHLGRRDSINTRNDLNWHRTMIWVSGFFYVPKFRYTITAWSLPTTQQTLVFGNMQYLASKYFNVGIGIAPSLTARSLQG